MSTGFRMRPGARAGVVAVALAAAAAMLSACATTGPAESADPTAPAAPAAAPVPLAPEQLQSPGLFERVSAERAVVLWATPGESLAVVIGGSGGGGDCIPQPQAARLERDTVTVAFDPPDPAVMCTADFTLHGWELALPEGADAGAETLEVDLHDLNGDGGTTTVTVGPDDLLVSPTADPQPSIVPGEPPAGSAMPTPIPESQLPPLDEAVPPGTLPQVAVRWIQPGSSLAVMVVGSYVAPDCNATPVGAWSTGPGTIEVAFDYPDGDRDCPADGYLYGWSFTLPEPVSVTAGVEVTVTGTMHDGRAAVITIGPEDVLSP